MKRVPSFRRSKDCPSRDAAGTDHSSPQPAQTRPREQGLSPQQTTTRVAQHNARRYSSTTSLAELLLSDFIQPELYRKSECIVEKKPFGRETLVHFHSVPGRPAVSPRPK